MNKTMWAILFGLTFIGLGVWVLAMAATVNEPPGTTLFRVPHSITWATPVPRSGRLAKIGPQPSSHDVFGLAPVRNPPFEDRYTTAQGTVQLRNFLRC